MSAALQEVINRFTTIAKASVTRFPVLSEDSEIKLLNYSENSTYLVTNPDGKKHVLRVSRPNYHTRDEIEYEMKWLTSIHENSDVEVALPIEGQDGEFVQKVNIEGDSQDYYCSLFTFLEGDTPDENQESELIRQFESLGYVTALLHQNSIDYHDTYKSYNRLTWDFENVLGEKPKWARWQDGLGMTPERKQLLQRVSDTIEKRLEKFGKDKTRFGLIHSDLRLANLLVDGNHIKVIDFDDCGFGWYLFDLGTSLSFIEHQPYVPELVRSWLKGYQKVRTLTEEEIEEIPTFILMRRLQLISWVGSRDNEFAQSLGAKFSEDTDKIAKQYLEEMEI